MMAKDSDVLMVPPFIARLSASQFKSWVALSSLVVVRPSRHGNISTIWCFRPYKPYIFWKLLVPGYQNWYYQVSHTQIHKYKYTNTQIQHITKCQKDPTCGIFLKRGLFRGIKNDIHMCQTRKYKNTNTQIHKYTNIAYDEVLERPSMWYIFENRIIQGYQKWYSCVSNAQIQKIQIRKYTNTAYDKVPDRPNMWYIF